MRRLRIYWPCILVLLAFCASTVPSYADSQSVTPSTCNLATSTCNGYSFQATLTPITPSASNGNTNYSLSYTITNVGGPAAHPQSWSLTLFPNQNTIGPTFTNFTMSENNTAYDTSGFQVYVGKSSNSVGGGGCNSAVSGGVCVLGTGTLPTLSKTGDSLTFNFDFSCSGCTQLSNWIFLSDGTNVNSGGNAYAISQAGTPMAVPEPSSPILLLCSFLAVLGLLAVPRVRQMLLPLRQSELSSLTSAT